MMSRAIFISILLLSNTILFAQVKHDYNWMLGYDASDLTPEGEGSLIDFNISPIQPQFNDKELDFRSANITMSDENGNLLFYSNGCEIYNAEHEQMENGDSINPGQVHDLQCGTGYIGSQSMLSLKKPECDSLYYIFHQHLIFETDPFEVKVDQLLYSTINIHGSNGLGTVINKNLIVLEDTLWPGEMTAVTHINEEDWWVVSSSLEENKYFTFLFSSIGISDVEEQNIGLPATRSGEGSGQAAFSPDGEKYARYNKIDQVYLFDFDRSTGQLSSFQHLTVADTASSGGLAFSPNSRFLYISSVWYIYQFDLWATDIQASKKLVATWDGYEELDFFDTNFYRMQLGPDCRIYINSTAGTSYLHAIRFPDLEGVACEVDQRAVKLPSYNARTMPHFPNYRLGTTPTYPCDPTIDLPVGIAEAAIENTNFTVFPNPAYQQVTLSYDGRLPDGSVWILYNSLGEEVRRVEMEQGAGEQEVSLIGLATGIYFYKVADGGRVVASGKVVLVE